MSRMKGSNLLAARAMAGKSLGWERTENRLSPTCWAIWEAVSTVFSPMPRRGVLTMRSRRISSSGLLMTLKYAIMSRTSFRSKNRVPPMIRWGTPCLANIRSKVRDWEFMR